MAYFTSKQVLNFGLAIWSLVLSALACPAQTVITKETKLNNPYGDEVALTEKVPSESAKDGIAWQVEVLKRDQNLVQLVLSYKYPNEIRKGDTLIYRADVRSMDADRRAMFELRVQDSANGYSTVCIAKDGAGNAFRTIKMQFRAEQDYSAGQLSMNLWPGYQVQKVQVQDISVTHRHSGGDGEGPRPEARKLGFASDDSVRDLTIGEATTASRFLGGDGGDPDGALRVRFAGTGASFSIPKIQSTPHYHLQLVAVGKGGAAVPLELRLLDHTAKQVWKSSLNFSAEWRELKRLIPPMKQNDSMALQMVATQPGEIELDELRLEYRTNDELGLRDFEPAGNLLSHSSFPFGLPELWNGVSQEVQSDTIATDNKTMGPTGSPALRLQSGSDHFQLNTAFIGQPGRKHTLSLWAKTNKPGYFGLRMAPPSETIWTAPWARGVHLETEWKRFHHTVELPFTSDGFYQVQLDLSKNAEVWIDGVMVEVADEPSEFKRADPIELSLKPVGDYAPLAIYHPDQPMQIAVQGLGDVPAGARLRLSTGFFDSPNRISGRDVALDPGAFQTRTLNCNAPGLPPLGSYRVEVQVIDSAGKPLSRKADTLLHRMRRPKAADRLALDSAFGVHIPVRDEYARAVKAMGANWVRNFNLGWREQIQGDQSEWQYDWTRADRQIKASVDAKLAILGILGYPLPWLTKAPDDFRGFRLRMFAPKDEHLAQWAEYAREIAGRYRGRIQAWETWNEPFWTRFFIDHVDEKGEFVQASPEKLLAMTRVSAKAIRQADPDAKIIWNMGGENHPEYDDGFAELDPWEYLDAVSYHSYASDLGGYAGDLFEQHATAVRPILKNHGAPPMEVWNSEGGPGGGHFHFFSPHGPARDMSQVEHRTASYIARAYCSMLANGVSKFFIYAHYYGHWKPDYLLLQPDGRFSPNAVAYSNTAWHLEGKSFAQQLPLDDGLHAYVFADESECVGFIAVNSGHGWKAPPIADRAEIVDVYGNRVKTDAPILSDVWIRVTGMNANRLIQDLRRESSP